MSTTVPILPSCPQVGFNGYSTHLIYNTPRPQCEAGQVWDPFDAMRVSEATAYTCCLLCCRMLCYAVMRLHKILHGCACGSHSAMLPRAGLVCAACPQVLVWSTWALIASLLLLLVLSYNLFPDYSGEPAPAAAVHRCCPLTATIAAINGSHCFSVQASNRPKCYTTSSEFYTPADPKSWERRCNCLGNIGRVLCCWGVRRSSSETRDTNGKSQRLSSRLGNLFSMVSPPLCATLGCCTCIGFQTTADDSYHFVSTPF